MLRVLGFVLRVLTNEYFGVTMTKHAITGQGKNRNDGMRKCLKFFNFRSIQALVNSNLLLLKTSSRQAPVPVEGRNLNAAENC